MKENLKTEFFLWFLEVVWGCRWHLVLAWIVKQQTLFCQVSEVNVSGRKGGLYFLAEIFNGRIYSNVTVITVTRKFANYCNYSNVDVSAISTGVLKHAPGSNRAIYCSETFIGYSASESRNVHALFPPHLPRFPPWFPLPPSQGGRIPPLPIQKSPQKSLSIITWKSNSSTCYCLKMRK